MAMPKQSSVFFLNLYGITIPNPQYFSNLQEPTTYILKYKFLKKNFHVKNL